MGCLQSRRASFHRGVRVVRLSARPHLRVGGSISLGWGLKICIPNKFSGADATAGQGTKPKKHWLEVWGNGLGELQPYRKRLPSFLHLLPYFLCSFLQRYFAFSMLPISKARLPKQQNMEVMPGTREGANHLYRLHKVWSVGRKCLQHYPCKRKEL